MAVRFVMIGGFLGAGKTTTLGRLAKMYAAQGKRVGVVTNDQAHDLVDTNTFRNQGLAVEEVPGACFCCRFDDLVSRVGSLQASDRPDVILAEPVGSCTDLVATVVQPLKDLYAGQFEVAPYAVLFKPSHGTRILKNQQAGGFSPKAAYIFKKQLEEADAIRHLRRGRGRTRVAQRHRPPHGRQAVRPRRASGGHPGRTRSGVPRPRR